MRAEYVLCATKGNEGSVTGWATDLLVSFTEFVNKPSAVIMNFRACDVVPISEARARLTELAEEVIGSGAEKLLTKNGAS